MNGRTTLDNAIIELRTGDNWVKKMVAHYGVRPENILIKVVEDKNEPVRQG